MCNSDRRHFLRMSFLTLGAVGIAGSALAAEIDPKKPKVYVCPPCGCAADGKEFPAPGTCPECGMDLIEKPAAPAQLSARGRSQRAGPFARQGASPWRADTDLADAGSARRKRAKAAVRLTT